MRKKLKKVAIIVGPTASGKTALAIGLAKQFNGEIISADSRQVYRGLDIGTEKTTLRERSGIAHHLIDIVDPGETYTAARFIEDADAAITDIVARGKLPVIAGGTLFYIEALLGRKPPANAPADPEWRATLQSLSPQALHDMLVKRDPLFAEKIDRHNPRRLIRALEVARTKGSVPAPTQKTRYDACIIGLDMPPEILRERINIRLGAALDRGLMKETKELLTQGVSASWLEEIGLEYRVALAYLRGECNDEEMRTVLWQKVWQYAKRQRTWLKKMKDVQWIPADSAASAAEITEKFLATRTRPDTPVQE